VCSSRTFFSLLPCEPNDHPDEILPSKPNGHTWLVAAVDPRFDVVDVDSVADDGPDRDVLEALARGDLSVEEAAEML